MSAASAEDDLLARLQSRVDATDAAAIMARERELSATALVPSHGAKHAPQTVLDAVMTLVNNKGANKYLFSIAVTSCVKKLLTPEQDIRLAQDRMENGYSNRSLDQRLVTPFLKRHGYTHCEASGVESGRNLENSLPWDLNYPCNPRGRGNREAFLGLLHYIQVQGGNPETVAVHLLWYDRSKSSASKATAVPPLEANIATIVRVLQRHFTESSGQGKARLPVLALYAVYSRLVEEMARYRGAVLLPLERHTTADLRSGAIGDIQIDKGSGPFEGVEVKSDKPITPDMVMELERKFGGKSISRYYLLTTRDPCVLAKDEAALRDAVRRVEGLTGCQIVVNGLMKTLQYYLRLLDDPSHVLRDYRLLMESDEDVRAELKSCWNAIVAEEYPG